MLFKRIFVAIFMIFFLGLVVWLIFEAVRPEILPLGSSMPELKYFEGNESQLIRPDSAHNTMIVLINSECEHCLYQLKQFNNHLEDFFGTRIFIFTTERGFFESDNTEKWPALTHAKNVYWGIVNRKEFKKNFGSMVTPYIFLFDKSDKLFDKIRGEVKLQKILKSLRNLDGPERRD